jgi:hypothetical protein
MFQRQPRQKQSNFVQKITKAKKEKRKKAGVMPQVVAQGPEFKYQYCQKKGLLGVFFGGAGV